MTASAETWREWTLRGLVRAAPHPWFEAWAASGEGALADASWVSVPRG